jgi:FixJ family two-component response regulator
VLSYSRCQVARRQRLDFQAELTKAQIQIPIIFITGHGDIPMSVKAMKAGAVEFLTKPFRDQDLLDAIQIALERSRANYANEKAISELRAKFDTLTPREQEVMAVGHGRPPEQAGRGGNRCHRDYGEGASG